jgi:alpha-tubulin suppressor-like RCC1 family protein
MCGSEFVIALKKDNTIWGCGRNNYGQLGLGDTVDRTTFTLIRNNIKSVSLGNMFSVIIEKYTNKCFSCGYNGNGELGLGDTNHRNIFTEITKLSNVSLLNDSIINNSLLLTSLSGQSINSTGSYSELTDFALNASAASKKLTISNFSLIPLPAEFNIPGKNVVSYELTDGTNTETVEYIM